jgi:hypothetical protein
MVARTDGDSGNDLGNGRSIQKIQGLSQGLLLSRPFPETRKHHAAAYPDCGQRVEYGKTLNVESIGGRPANSGC